MELEIKPQSPVGQAPAPAEKAVAKPVEPATGDGTAKPVVEKPGRAAAAAKKAQREAAVKGAEADAKVAAAEKAKPVVESVEKYQAAIASGDPDKILAAFGVDDEKLVDMYIAKHGAKDTEGGTKAEKDAAVEELRAELAKFKQELADEKAKGEEKRQAEEAASSIRSHVAQLQQISAKPENAERFEMVNAEPGAHELAFDVMVEVHQKQGKFISYEEALDATEAHLLEQEKARIARNAKIKKLGGAVPAKKDEQPTTASGDQSMDAVRAAFKAARPRVTNAMTASFPGSAVKPRGKSEVDKRFREKVLAIQRGATN